MEQTFVISTRIKLSIKTEQEFDNVSVKIVNYKGEIKLMGKSVIKVPKNKV